jgi:uncharacterized protein YjaG (DUF416 family)
MLTRLTLIGIVVVAVVPSTVAKNKNKQVLPNQVLQAQTVAVVIMPDAGESVTDPAANRTAELNVEKALLQWGRYRLIPDAQTAGSKTPLFTKLPADCSAARRDNPDCVVP